MHGTLSQTNSGRGIAFYKIMALAVVLSNIIFGALYLFVLSSGNELFWDRLVICIFGILVFLHGHSSKISTSRYAALVSVLFYVNTTHVIWTVAYNDFDGFYFLSLFIITQACAYSLRDERATFWYLLYMCVMTFAGLLIFSDTDSRLTSSYAVIIILISVLQYLASRIKCKFMRDMKMNQEMLQSLISKSEDAVFLTDMNGNIFDVNFRVTELFGYDRNEIINRDFKILRKNTLKENDIESGLSELELKKFWTTEAILIKKDRKEFPVRISITLIKSAMKKYLVYRVLDITSVKENEAKIIEARDRAEEAVLAKGQFLAVMSHEIRTPLNGVIATASLLQQTELDVEQEEYSSTIKKSGQSLLMLINDILEFSKMESGKMLLDPQFSRVDEAIFDVADLLRPHAESKGVKLEVNLSSNVPQFMMFDGYRLKQILFNLVGNAIKFTDHGKVEISIECKQILHDEVTLLFKVIDSGIGIPKEKMHLLFQLFSQIDSSTSRKYGGTGLGLAISKQLVDLMGGHFEVDSNEGIGTTFSFYIKGKVTNEMEMHHETEALIDMSKIDFHSISVLVGEDNEINRQVMKFILESLNIKSDFAANGELAIEACRNLDYDIIFMDMHMPIMDGLTATKVIRESMVHQPHIVAITANTYEDDRLRCAEAGMNDFLAKPFEPEQMKVLIAKWYLSSGRDVYSAA